MYLTPANAFHVTKAIELELGLSGWNTTDIINVLEEIQKPTPNWPGDLGIVKSLYENPGIKFGPLRLESSQFDDVRLIVKLGVYAIIKGHFDTLPAEQKLQCAKAFESCSDYLRKEIEEMPKKIQASLNAIMAKKIEKREKCLESAFPPVALFLLMMTFLYKAVSYQMDAKINPEEYRKLTLAVQLILTGIVLGMSYYQMRGVLYRLKGGVDRSISTVALTVARQIKLTKDNPKKISEEETAYLKKTN